MEKVGKYAFIVGIVIALLAGARPHEMAPAFLAILGVVVGFLNVTAEETKGFLISAIALMMSATALDSLPAVGEALAPFIGNIVAFMGAAVFVVAIKTLLTVARD